MPTIKFIGRVHSPGIEVTFDFIPSITWTITDTGKQWHFKTTITRSVVEVTCDIDEYLPIQLRAIQARAHDLVSSCLDLGSLAMGTPVTLLFDEMIDPSGKRSLLWIVESDLAKLCTAFNLKNTSLHDREQFAKIMNIVLGDYALARAVNDLTQTLHAHTHVAINCGRVIDGLRKIEAPNIGLSQGWHKLRQILNADEKYLSYVSRKSADPRHGDRTVLPLHETDELTERTWKIMNRYIVYRERGRQTLLLSEFPMLLG